MENYRKYIPVTCWKCGKMNNSAVTQICNGCGIYLKTPASGERGSNLHNDSIFENSAVRSGLISGAIFIACIGLLIFLYNYKSSPASVASSSANSSKPSLAPIDPSQIADVKKFRSMTAEMPSNGWYKKSFWSYIYEYPTAEQIFAKNIEVSGKPISIETIQSIFVAGSFSLAVTNVESHFETCYNTGGYYHRNKEEFSASPSLLAIVSTLGTEKVGCDTLEDSLNKPYYQFANVEIFADKSGKSLKHAKVLDGKNLSKVVAETKEAFNENKGWKQTLQYNGFGNMVSNQVSDLNGDEISDLKKNLKDIWINNYTAANRKVTGLAKMGFKTAYVLETNSEDSETLYFDAVSGLLLRADRGDLTIFFDDYRDFEGSKTPFMMYFRKDDRNKSSDFAAIPNFTFTWLRFEISQWKLNDVIADSLFEKPQK